MALDLAMDYGENLISLSINGKAVPFNNFTYRVATNAEEIHLPSKWNAGWHHLPPQFSATFTVYAVKGVPFLVTEAQLKRSIIKIVVTRRSVANASGVTTGKELAIRNITLAQGKIVDSSGQGFNGRDITSIAVTARFNSFSLTGADAKAITG